METPVSLDAEDIRNEKVDIFYHDSSNQSIGYIFPMMAVSIVFRKLVQRYGE